MSSPIIIGPQTSVTAHPALERRFVVTDPTFSPNRIPFHGRLQKIAQGYFSGPLSNPVSRIRVITLENGRQIGQYAEQVGEGVNRSKLEEELDPHVATLLYENGTSDRLTKTRYLVLGGWKVDFFHAPLTGIVIAEHAVTTPEEEITPPSWLGETIEVTKSLSNVHLARLATFLRARSGDAAVELAQIVQYSVKNVSSIVITGTVCTGKTTIMEAIEPEYRDRLHFVPEVATIVINQVGIDPRVNDPSGIFPTYFQRCISASSEIFEATTLQYVKLLGKRGAVFDRAKADGRAYMESWDKFQQIARATREDIYHDYDRVLCLGVVPRQIYEQCRYNNSARKENYEQAVALQDKILAAWGGHPNFDFIDGGLDHKIAAVKRHLDDVLKK